MVSGITRGLSQGCGGEGASIAKGPTNCHSVKYKIIGFNFNFNGVEKYCAVRKINM